ncbi:MAG TPA: DNA replication/repair protein RecF [Ruminococcaceae bacterium]|nr:DNA replication/repair protein RecF [Oscillospiraceae bacterium]
MIVESLSAAQFRNLSATEFFPGEGVNIICGANGLGKTNLIESIWLFTGCRSFRSVRDREMIQIGCDKANLRMSFFSGSRHQQAQLQIDEKRHFTLNGVSLPSGRMMMGEFACVAFTPLHLAIVKDGPEERRRFSDIAISQLRPNYAKTVLEYNGILSQRNAALRTAKENPSMDALVDLWDEPLAKKGAVIIEARMKYLEKLNEKAAEIYEEISSGREKLSLAYRAYAREKTNADLTQIKDSLLQSLAARHDADLEHGSTGIGPHREEFSIRLSDISARTYGSQGQQRSAALVLKLAEADLFADVTGEEPVILLDDVFSELDPSRQKYVVKHFENRQVFITCCDEASVVRLAEHDVAVHDIQRLRGNG